MKNSWYVLRKRLNNIIDPSLNISFNYSPVRKKTQYSEIIIRFFQVKLDDEIIYKYPRDTNQSLYNDLFIYNLGIERPFHSILRYIDLPKTELINFKDEVNMADILKASDKRIGYERLKNLELSEVGRKVFERRFERKKLS